ncbi:MAG: ABC transporter ATP-binding protein [Solirubrobacteraceae bacterium]
MEVATPTAGIEVATPTAGVEVPTPTPGIEVATPTPGIEVPPGAEHARAAVEEPALLLEGAVRRYGERAALAGVSFALPRDGTLAVLGANGAGKTTLLRMLASLLRPHAGRVQVLGCELPSEAWRLRGRIGLLAHEPLLYRELTARENLAFHGRLHGVARGRVQEALESVGVAARADEPLRTLSRGTVQRVAIARAVLHEPELLLLDEPRANLDPAASEIVEPLIGRAADQVRPCTRVIVSHNPREGIAEADVVLGLRAGGVALLAPAGDVSEADVLELYR